MMTPWLWFLIAGALLFLVSCGVYRAWSGWFVPGYRPADHGKEQLDTHFPSEISISALLSTGYSNEALSSVYHGTTYFFDSIEDHDTFEASLHRPVEPATQTASAERNSRPVGRSFHCNRLYEALHPPVKNYL